MNYQSAANFALHIVTVSSHRLKLLLLSYMGSLLTFADIRELSNSHVVYTDSISLFVFESFSVQSRFFLSLWASSRFSWMLGDNLRYLHNSLALDATCWLPDYWAWLLAPYRNTIHLTHTHTPTQWWPTKWSTQWRHSTRRLYLCNYTNKKNYQNAGQYILPSMVSNFLFS